jgi:hypothetical protein
MAFSKQRKRAGGTTSCKPKEQLVLLSGECCQVFKFRLIGIERLDLIFDELQLPVATNNETTIPKNVSLLYENVFDVIGKGKDPLLKGTQAKKDGILLKNLKRMKNFVCKPTTRPGTEHKENSNEF